jgi:N-acyl homoserine lactone hydrolase
VKIHAQPKPLHEALSGGTQGATVTVEPLIGGHVHWPLEMMERPGGHFENLKILRKLLAGKGNLVPCPAFLIRHPSAGAILVDTGLHPSIASDPKENFGSTAVRLANPQLAPGEDVPAQLRGRGLDPSQVPIVVMTHLHYDHASGLAQFPGAQVLVDEREWTHAARGRMPDGYLTRLFPTANDWRLLPGHVDTIDLLGDGTIRLLSTPGHTPGHRSVILRLAEGRELLLTADAAYARRTLDEGLTPLLTWDDDAYRASLARLQAWVAAHPDAPVVTGHDRDETWAALPPVFA